MGNETKTKRSIIAFIIGAALGRVALNKITHLIYISLIILSFLFGRIGPINTYLEAKAKTTVKEEQIQKAVNRAQPELENMKNIAEQLKVANNTLLESLKVCNKKPERDEH